MKGSGGVDAIGYGSNRTGYYTFHQMGSARMGSDPATSVVDDRNRVHGVDGLYVMDGSCFPTASGVNPMLSIASIAHRGATLLARQIG
jgi:choline dehydrogenase-like flavoprotein